MEVGCSLQSVCIYVYDSKSRVLKGTTESVIFGIGTSHFGVNSESEFHIRKMCDVFSYFTS